MVVAARVSEVAAVSLVVKNAAGTTVRSASISGDIVRFAWDMRTSAGTLVPDGDYGWTLRARDSWGNATATRTGSFTVDGTPPVSKASTASTAGQGGWSVTPVTVTLVRHGLPQRRRLDQLARQRRRDPHVCGAVRRRREREAPRRVPRHRPRRQPRGVARAHPQDRHRRPGHRHPAHRDGRHHGRNLARAGLGRRDGLRRHGRRRDEDDQRGRRARRPPRQHPGRRGRRRAPHRDGRGHGRGRQRRLRHGGLHHRYRGAGPGAPAGRGHGSQVPPCRP